MTRRFSRDGRRPTDGRLEMTAMIDVVFLLDVCAKVGLHNIALMSR
jgi:hypothetical protein